MPKIFGVEHILFLSVFIIISIIALYFSKKKIKTEKTLTQYVKILGIIQFILIFLNRLAIYHRISDPVWFDFIPTTFCGTTSFVVALTLIFAKKDSNLMQFSAFCAMLGGILSTIYPDYIGQADSIFFDKTITGLLHHAMLTFNFFFISITGYFRPNFKRWKSLPLGLCIYITLGTFYITELGSTNAMDIHRPLIEGTIFTWWFVGILLMILYTILLVVYEKIHLPEEERFISQIIKKIRK